MSKKILFCTSQFSTGGVSRVVEILTKTLTRLGNHVTVWAPSCSDAGQVDIPVPNLPMPGLLGSLPFWEVGVTLARKWRKRYDAVFFQQPILLSDEYFDIGENIVVTFHNTYYGYALAQRVYRFGRFGPYYSFARSLERRLLQHLSHVQNMTLTGVSPFVLSELHANGYSGTPSFIPNGIPDLEEFTERGKARETLNQRAGLCLQPNDIVVLYVGSGKSMASKRPLLVPTFLREVDKKVEGVKLLMVGNGSLSHESRRLKEEFKDCSYLGLVGREQLHYLYSCADAFISLSCYEGLPNSALEAASYGLPMILSDIPVHKWMLLEKIGFGVLVNSQDPIQNVDTVCSFLRSGACSRQYLDSTTQRRFSWEKIAVDYLKAARIT